MKIFKSQINSNQTPPIVKEHSGHVNRVLAIRKDTKYDKTNTYMPNWDVVNTIYYNAHKDSFEGWIELEASLPADSLL